MRRVELVRMGSTTLVGTGHVPEALHGSGVGFLFLNAGHAPREGHAGITVRLADRLASMGFPAYRFDLPGLGDSPGEVPQDLEAFFRSVHDGAQAEVAVGLAREVLAKSGLTGLVLGGLCGGAANGLLVSEALAERVVGLVALEPEFLRPGQVTAKTLGAKLVTRASWLRLATGHSRYSGRYGWVGRLMLALASPRLLPPETNQRLVSIWKRLVRRGQPIFVVLAEGKPRALFYDQLVQALFRGRPTPSVTALLLPNTNHIFTSGQASERIVDEVCAWASRTFDPASPAQ